MIRKQERGIPHALGVVVMQESVIHDQIEAYHRDQASLRITTSDPWVVFSGAKFQSRFSSFEQAYEYAVSHFKSGEYLIRELGADAPFVPMVYVAQ